jgi:hypothetical protein
MKTRTVVIGLVILVIGIAFVIGGGLGALGSISINRTFTQPQPGEYVSAEIVLNTTSDLAVSSPAAVGGIIHAKDLSQVNSANINSYAIPYNSTGAGSDIYKSLGGGFYYVAFSSTQPSTTIVATPLRSSVVGYGVLVLLGIVCIIAGIVIAAVGAIQKTKVPVQQQT